MKYKFLIAALTLFIAGTAAAQNGPGLKDENRRIRQGVVNGQLTPAETVRLKTQERRLREEAIRYKMNDGHISACERRDLRRDNRRLNRQIFIQKHDRQRRSI
ncbi:MAG: hypothetical protein QM791_16240 [Ferruginibacter sp.]